MQDYKYGVMMFQNKNFNYIDDGFRLKLLLDNENRIVIFEETSEHMFQKFKNLLLDTNEIVIDDNYYDIHYWVDEAYIEEDSIIL